MKQVLGFLMMAGGFIGLITFLASQTNWTAVAIAVGIAAGITLWVGTAVWLLLD